MRTSLARLPIDATAVLLAVNGERPWRRRLLEMGFVPGTELRLVRRLRASDVLEVQLRESRVSLRISEAEAVAVELRP